MKPQPSNPTSPNIGVEEAAAIVRCGIPTLRKLIDADDLPAL